MSKQSIFFLFLFFPFFSLASAAESHEPSEESRTWVSSIGRDLAAPLRGDGRTALLIGAGAALAAYPFRNDVLAVGRSKPLGSTSSIGYELGFWRINLAYTLGYLGYGFGAGDEEAIRKSTMMIRATAYTGLITTGLKELQLEERPRKNGDMRSFPSGHASNAFTFAGVVYRNHGWILGAPAFGMAGFVSFSRLNDNAHYLHDVLFGGAIGLSYALGLDSSWNSSKGDRTAAFVPLLSSEAFGMGAVIDF